MKEAELQIEDKQVEERQVKKGFFYKRTVYLKPGQRIWELELKTGVLKEATYDESNYNIVTRTGVRRINEKEHHYYLPAINWKNAYKKFNKAFQGKLKIIKETV